MSTTINCDKCEKILDDTEIHFSTDDGDSVDLCFSCSEMFYHWLKEKPTGK